MADAKQQLPLGVEHGPDVVRQLVDVRGEIAELVPAVVLDAVIEVAPADLPGTLADGADRAEQPADAQVGDEEPDEADRENDRQQGRSRRRVADSRRGNDDVEVALVDLQEAVIAGHGELDILE